MLLVVLGLVVLMLLPGADAAVAAVAVGGGVDVSCAASSHPAVAGAGLSSSQQEPVADHNRCASLPSVADAQAAARLRAELVQAVQQLRAQCASASTLQHAAAVDHALQQVLAAITGTDAPQPATPAEQAHWARLVQAMARSLRELQGHLGGNAEHEDAVELRRRLLAIEAEARCWGRVAEGGALEVGWCTCLPETDEIHCMH